MHSGEGSGSWSLLGSVFLDPFRLDRSLSDDQDGVLQFGLEFLHQLSVNLSECLQRWEWDDDDDDLSGLSFDLDVEISDFGDGDFLQLVLEFGR